jgi:glycosyltransferase involved in cell wall biosynthesis
MRILQVVALLSPDGAYGGPARVALNQSAELIQQGHQVTLAAATRGFDSPPTELNGVPVRLFDARTLIPGTGFPGMGSPGLFTWFRANCRDFDVVHIHFGRDLVVLPVAASARAKRIPYVLQTHGMVIPSSHPLSGPLDAVWTRKLLRDASAVLYLTEQERAQLVEVAGRKLHLLTLGNGVPEYPAATDHPGPPEVLFVARMHARKRPLMFVEMAKALLHDGFDARFTLVGPDEGQGPALRSALRDDPRISWEGAMAPAQIAQRMATASVYVLPSIHEPYPMSVLEAMAVGLPVVVSADCGLAPLVNRTGCGIVTDGELPTFTSAVRSLLMERHSARAMGNRGRAAAHDDFGMQAIGEQLVTVYDQAGSTTQRKMTG